MKSRNFLNLVGSKKRETQKGFALAAVVFAMLTLSAVGMSMSSSLSNQSLKTNVDLQANQAFYVAEGGLQYILAQAFRGDTDFSDNDSPTPAPYAGGAIDFGRGEFWVEYSNVTPTSITVTVTSRVEDSIRTIEQEVDQIIPLSYAFAGTNNLVLAGVGTLNGNVSAGGSVNVGDDFVVNGTIYESNDITLPDVDFQDYVAMTTETDTNGTLHISGNYDHDIYAEGNVDIGNNANVTGIIVTDGNISIGKNVTLTGCLVAAGNINSNNLSNANFSWQYGSQGQVLPVLAAEGNINLTGKDAGGAATTANIDGILIAEGNISFHTIQDSNIVMDGFMFAHSSSDANSVSGDGEITINYNAALAAAIAENNLALTEWQEV